MYNNYYVNYIIIIVDFLSWFFLWELNKFNINIKRQRRMHEQLALIQTTKELLDIFAHELAMEFRADCVIDEMFLLQGRVHHMSITWA